MVQFVPFAAWRYDLSQVGALSEVTAPSAPSPDGGLIDELYQRHPCNAVRLVSNREEPGDSSFQDRCSRADDFFRLWKREGILIREHEATLYVYEQTTGMAGRERTSLSVIGRLKIADDDDPSVILASPPAAQEVTDSLQLLRTTGAQFRPIEGLLLPHTTQGTQTEPGSDSAFGRLRTAVHGLTPLEIHDDAGVRHRIWPLRSHSAVHAFQQALTGCRALITANARQYVAARLFRDQQAVVRPEATEHDNAGYVMACLTSSSDAGLSSLPEIIRIRGHQQPSFEQLSGHLQQEFTIHHTGAEESAAADACELAALHDIQPCLAIGSHDGHWAMITARHAPPSVAVGITALQERRRLAQAVLSTLREPCNNAPHEPAATREFLPPTDAAYHSLWSSGQAVTLLIPPLSVSQLISAEDQLPALPGDGFRLWPSPLAGLVCYSLEH